MSQRPILLVDPDREFHALLSRELGPYGFQVVQDTSADALAQVAKLGVVAVVIAVDEPDKKGYATFNKAKKGVAANVPVVLVTSSVAIDAFAAHRKLKVHADEYLDKRGLSTAELLGKLDNLIGLGELTSDGELAIPVEVDEVAIDDDVLVDEVDSAALDLGDGEDFNEGAHTVHSSTGFDDLIDAETDAAFAALTDAMPIEAAQAALARTPSPTPAPPVAPVAEPIVEPIAEPIVEPSIEVEAAIPEPIAAPAPLPLAEGVIPESIEPLEPLETFESVSASLSLTDLEPLPASDAAIELPPLEEPAPAAAAPPPPAPPPPPRGRPTT
ncbi:MAG: response regulator, partial [Myxococcales bacterium]|nr:response regulator [Myxococcales bacterium]